MLMSIKSRLGLKVGHIRSKTRSLGQIIEKTSVHSRGHSIYPKFLKACQNVNSYNI